MTLNPEEMRKKRQQAAARRKNAQKRLIIRLSIVGILLLAFILILTISLRSCKKKPETAETTQITEPESSQPATTVIHLAAAGDLNVTQRVVASGGAEYDYGETFLDVAYLLADADLALVNLEGNLCGAPYGSNASAPQSLVTALDLAGVDGVQLANSYSINRGISGLISTIDGVSQAGMEPLGVFRDQAEFERKQGFSLFEVQGVRIAVVSFTKGMDGTTLPPGNESCVNVLYQDYNSTYQNINEEKIKSILTAVNQQKPDITIAMLHWGSEYNDTISKSQEEICEMLTEQGVDAIIGTHPHYVQQVELKNGKLIAYSLGDFIGDAPRSGTEYSIILDMEITKDNTTGNTAVTGYTYTPVFTVAENNRPLRVVRIREAIAAYEAGYIDAVSPETYEAMKYALERVDRRVAGD